MLLESRGQLQLLQTLTQDTFAASSHKEAVFLYEVLNEVKDRIAEEVEHSAIEDAVPVLRERLVIEVLEAIGV